MLVMCTLNGHCPKCVIPNDQLGNHCCLPAWDYTEALETYDLADEDTHQFHAACRMKGLKPLVDVFLSITLDVLHQLLQGVVKHITAWLSDLAVFGWDRASQHTLPCLIAKPPHDALSQMYHNSLMHVRQRA